MTFNDLKEIIEMMSEDQKNRDVFVLIEDEIYRASCLSFSVTGNDVFGENQPIINIEL